MDRDKYINFVLDEGSAAENIMGALWELDVTPKIKSENGEWDSSVIYSNVVLSTNNNYCHTGRPVNIYVSRVFDGPGDVRVSDGGGGFLSLCCQGTESYNGFMIKDGLDRMREAVESFPNVYIGDNFEIYSIGYLDNISQLIHSVLIATVSTSIIKVNDVGS